MSEPNLETAEPCPFCGGNNLMTELWTDEDRGEFDAICCRDCLGTAPADKWNDRSNQ